MQQKTAHPNNRFPCPISGQDELTISEDDFRLTSNQLKHKRLEVKEELEAFLPDRPVLIVGVTKKLQIADGTEQGAMHPGRAYQVTRADFIKMKMDPYRSPHMMVLEPRVPCMYFEVSRAINQLWPNSARNTFLATM
jgi:hypothetical protein